MPARLQLWWEGESFARESLPASRLAYTGADSSPRVGEAQLAAAGRSLVGQFGCARCHQSAFPAVNDPPPGPSLADAGRRLSKVWLMNWLADPAKSRTDAHMPRLFPEDRAGFVERWIITESLTAGARRRRTTLSRRSPSGTSRVPQHRCATCPSFRHSREGPTQRGQSLLIGLGDRMSARRHSAFLGNPTAVTRTAGCRRRSLQSRPGTSPRICCSGRSRRVAGRGAPEARELQAAYATRYARSIRGRNDVAQDKGLHLMPHGPR